jgi:excisionase family DNA binding protein
MTDARPILERAAARLAGRVSHLEALLDSGDDSAWHSYIAAVEALVGVLGQLAPGAGGKMLTTAQMADRLGVAKKTLLRWHSAGRIRPARKMGERGQAALRWTGGEAVR